MNYIIIYIKLIWALKTKLHWTFKWLFNNKIETNDNKYDMFDLENSNNTHSINDPLDDE